MRQDAASEAIGNQTEWLRSRVSTCVDVLLILDSIEELEKSENKDALEKAATKFATCENPDGSKFVWFEAYCAFKGGAKWDRGKDD